MQFLVSYHLDANLSDAIFYFKLTIGKNKFTTKGIGQKRMVILTR